MPIALSQIRQDVRDDLADTSTTFLSDDILNRYIMRAQQDFVERTECVEDTWTTTTVAGTQGYDLPVDCIGIERVSFDNSKIDHKDYASFDTTLIDTDSTGTPEFWDVFGEDGYPAQIKLGPPPASAATLKLFYYKMPPLYAFTLAHSDASATAVTVEVTAADVEFIVTGGSNAGTYTKTFASATTVAEIISWANALGVGFTATISPDCRSDEPSTRLEAFASVSWISVTNNLFLQISIRTALIKPLRDLIVSMCFEREGDGPASDRRAAKYEYATQPAYARARRRKNQECLYFMRTASYYSSESEPCWDRIPDTIV